MKYAFKKVRGIRIYDLETKEHLVTLNDLTSFQWTGGQDTIYSDGADGAHLVGFDVKKVSGIKASSGIIDSGYLSLQVGSSEKVVANGTGVKIREEIEVTDATKVTLAHKPSGDVGNELGFIYLADKNGIPGTSFTQAATASTTEFAFAPDTKEITLPTGKFKVGDTVVIDYNPTFKEYTEIVNETNKFSKSGEIIIDAWFTDLCTEKDIPLLVRNPKGKISGTMDYSAGDQAAVQNIEIEAMSKPCAGESNVLWKLYTYNMEDIVDA